MPALNLKNMDVDALLILRSQIDGQLATRRSDLQKQLARLQRLAADAPVVAPNGGKRQDQRDEGRQGRAEIPGRQDR